MRPWRSGRSRRPRSSAGRPRRCASAATSRRSWPTRGLLDKVRADIVPNNGALDAHDLHDRDHRRIRGPREAQRPAARGRPRRAAAHLRHRPQPHALRAGRGRARGPAGDAGIPRAPAGGHAPDPHRQRRARPEPRGTRLAPAQLQALLPDDGAPALADQAHRRRLQADLADDPARLDRMGRPGAGVVAAARASAHLLRGRRRDQGPRLRPRDPLALRHPGLSPSRPPGGAGSAGEALRGLAEAGRRLRGLGEDRPARGALLEQLPLPGRRVGRRAVAAPERLGAGLAPLVFPLEHDARRAAARPRRARARSTSPRRCAAKSAG